MTISSTGKTVSPRQKRAKLKGETTVEEVENNQGQSLNKEQVEPNAELSVEASEQEQIHGKLAVAGAHSITGSNWEIAGTVSIAGLRPISTSTLEVVETIDIMGLRPITAYDIDRIYKSGKVFCPVTAIFNRHLHECVVNS